MHRELEQQSGGLLSRAVRVRVPGDAPVSAGVAPQRQVLRTAPVFRGRKGRLKNSGEVQRASSAAGFCLLHSPFVQFAPVAQLPERPASNRQVAGGIPAGSANLSRVSPTTRDAPLRTERLGVEIPHAVPISIALVAQGRGGGLKPRTVPVQVRPGAPPRVAQSAEASRSRREGCRCESCHADFFEK